jgi:hypothetical protein
MRLHVAAWIVRALLPAMLCLTLLACGNSDGAEDDGIGSLGTCAIRADVTGGIAQRFTGKDDAACATQHSFDSDLQALFIGTSAQGTFDLVVHDVAEGETGSDYPARVIVTGPALARWQGSGCLASISEHRLLEVEASEIGELRHYQVSGEGTCSEPLEAVPAGGDAATVGPFAFRAEFTWRD